MVKIFHLYGVMEDIEGPDTAGDDVRGLGEALGSFRIFFKKIIQQDQWKRIWPMGGSFGLQDPLN